MESIKGDKNQSDSEVSHGRIVCEDSRKMVMIGSVVGFLVGIDDELMMTISWLGS